MSNTEEFAEMLKMFRVISNDHFKEIELAICKGKRLHMKEIIKHLKVCVRTARKDQERGVPTESILETTLGALESMVLTYAEELKESVDLVSKSAEQRA